MCECSGSDDCTICSADLHDKIIKSECRCLNEQTPNSLIQILKPNRTLLLSSDAHCISDCDGEVIVRIVFGGSVKLQQIFVKSTEPVSDSKIFLNDLLVDFSSLSQAKPAQQWMDLEMKRENGILQLECKTVKFLNVNSFSLWLKSKHTENLSLQHLGFSGEFLYSRKAPVITSYEVAPQAKKMEESDLLNGAFY